MLMFFFKFYEDYSDMAAVCLVSYTGGTAAVLLRW